MNKEIVEAIPVISYTCGYEPSTCSSPSIAKEHASDDDGKAKTDSAVHMLREFNDHSEHGSYKRHECCRRASSLGIRNAKPIGLVELRMLFFGRMLRLRSMFGSSTLSHPWPLFGRSVVSKSTMTKKAKVFKINNR
ncbi:hypothetical protein SH501x_001794 [Pirellulaceae bacterium SH501]